MLFYEAITCTYLLIIYLYHFSGLTVPQSQMVLEIRLSVIHNYRCHTCHSVHRHKPECLSLLLLLFWIVNFSEDLTQKLPQLYLICYWRHINSLCSQLEVSSFWEDINGHANTPWCWTTRIMGFWESQHPLLRPWHTFECPSCSPTLFSMCITPCCEYIGVWRRCPCIIHVYKVITS